jgi:hypothetical protein
MLSTTKMKVSVSACCFLPFINFAQCSAAADFCSHDGLNDVCQCLFVGYIGNIVVAFYLDCQSTKVNNSNKQKYGNMDKNQKK